MKPEEFLKTIWICEPPKGSLKVEDVIEAMELYAEHFTKNQVIESENDATEIISALEEQIKELTK